MVFVAPSIPAEPIVAVDAETAQTVVQIDLKKMQPHTPGRNCGRAWKAICETLEKHWRTWHRELGCNRLRVAWF